MNKHHSLFALVAFLILSGCETEEQPIPQNTINDSATPLTKVSLQLNWFPEAEHGGYYAALIHGAYKEEGLDVEIIGGGPNSPVIQKLVSGQADFIVGNADQVLTSRAKDSNAVALFAPLQTSPRCIMVHEGSGINSLSDLNDMTLGISAGRAFALYMQKHLPLKNIKFVGYPGSPAVFLSNENYGQQAYVFSEPFVARKSGANPKVLMVSDLGYNPYTSLLITTQETVNSDKDLIDRMIRASRKGWAIYLDDSTKTDEHIHTLNEEMDLEILAFGAKTLKELSLPDGMSSDTLGNMTSARWEQLRDQLIELELIDQSVDANAAFLK